MCDLFRRNRLMGGWLPRVYDAVRVRECYGESEVPLVSNFELFDTWFGVVFIEKKQCTKRSTE